MYSAIFYVHGIGRGVQCPPSARLGSPIPGEPAGVSEADGAMCQLSLAIRCLQPPARRVAWHRGSAPPSARLLSDKWILAGAGRAGRSGDTGWPTLPQSSSTPSQDLGPSGHGGDVLVTDPPTAPHHVHRTLLSSGDVFPFLLFFQPRHLFFPEGRAERGAPSLPV